MPYLLITGGGEEEEMVSYLSQRYLYKMKHKQYCLGLDLNSCSNIHFLQEIIIPYTSLLYVLIQPYHTNRIRNNVTALNSVWIQCFPFLKPVAHSGQLFTHMCRENSWLHTFFFKGICTMWNTNSLISNDDNNFNTDSLLLYVQYTLPKYPNVGIQFLTIVNIFLHPSLITDNFWETGVLKLIYFLLLVWHNYHLRKWTKHSEFKSSIKLFGFHFHTNDF